ncbi:MAG: methyltransferase domain-containing protein [Porticoccus sp.]|mgnify:FL=1|jgi:predicted nicotinamide N-methyase|uniref:class I SAM-dependent methyltransferase n=1 Tax=Porticoccus sp. TaxID=2024853 RepID=UPI0032987873
MSLLRVRYQTIEFGELDIHIRTLRSNLEYSDPDGDAEALGISSASWPLFGVVWDSAKALAHHMLNQDTVGKRILEVGCGIGLASLVLNHGGTDITATDYHPRAGEFLDINVQLNQGQPIPFVRTGWADEDLLLGKFDMIIGSDVLYEREHVDLLAAFIDRHARPTCEVIIVDPGRGHHAPFSKKMIQLGYTSSQQKIANTDYLPETFSCQVLQYYRQ